MARWARSATWRGLLEWWRPARATGPDPSWAAGRGAEHRLEDAQSAPHAPDPGEDARREALAVDPGAADWTEALEITDAELEEFLACDLDPVQADPDFRERLREELWEMVRAGELARRQDH